MKTKITDLLGTKHPIVEAAMGWVGDVNLAVGVCEAGGLGVLGPNAGQYEVTTDVELTGERLREQIQMIRSRTDKPFGVNFVVGVPGVDKDFSDVCVKVGIEEKVPIAVISQGSPKVYTPMLKEAGMTVIYCCGNVEHAIKAQAAGADAIVASGTEGAGHSGFDMLTTFCLVPQVASAVQVPVIAGGGIGDGHGLAAALALGAEAIYMGTRFLCTQESRVHPDKKQIILEARAENAMMIGHGSRAEMEKDPMNWGAARRGALRFVVNNILREKLMELTGGPLFEDVVPYMVDPSETGGSYTAGGLIYGEGNATIGGQVAGLIGDVPTCKDLIAKMMSQAEAIIDQLKAKASA